MSESTTDIPEHRDRKKPPPGDPRLTPGEKRGYETATGIAVMSDKEYWDRRARTGRQSDDVYYAKNIAPPAQRR